LTWSGRGRQPVWLRQALADGISWSALTVDLLPV
jgi:DNA-binding protein H-NS